jgi:flagellar hook-length control protein FliK
MQNPMTEIDLKAISSAKFKEGNKEIMSSNAFVMPALPQTPASGLNRTDTKGPAVFKSNRIDKSSDQSKSFSATLNRISDRNHHRNPKSTASDKPALTSRGSDTDSAPSKKMSKNPDSHRNHIEAAEAPVSGETAASIHPLQVFGLMHPQLMHVSMADDGSLAVEPPSGSTTDTGLLMLTNLIGHFQTPGQPAQGERVGIGPFEQLQANISPEATNRSFFEQLAGRAIQHQDSRGLPGMPDGSLGFWYGMALTPVQDGTLNGQAESSGANGNPALNPLLQMLGMTAAAWGLNTDIARNGESKMAAGLEGAHLNEDFLLKMTAPSQPAETGIFENAKVAVADPNGRLSLWAPGDSNAETLLEAQARQMNESSPSLKIQAALKAAGEQPAQPNSATEGITAKTPEEIFGIKSGDLKSEILSLDGSGNKISQIDADSKDSGFLFSQDQLPQHLARTENGAQPSETARHSLMSQTANQIVQKAVLTVNNGQHEVQIDLKPDFLGHIRMQIVSEGQQIAIKIVAEFPFVKDMLENNLHQLKAELQAQGLDIDELEVSVAHDSHAEGDTHESAEAAKLQAVKNGSDSDDGSSEELNESQSQGGGPMAETAIDYFA